MQGLQQLLGRQGGNSAASEPEEVVGSIKTAGNLLPAIDFKETSAANLEDGQEAENAFKLGGSATVNSDPEIDEQMLFMIVFKNQVDLTEMSIRADMPPVRHASASPAKTVKIFTNLPHLDCDDAEQLPGTLEITLNDDDLAGRMIPLPARKFRDLHSLQVFILDNQDGAEITFINQIVLHGRSETPLDMENFHKQSPQQ
ncbi:MAG: hypothetical protein MHM6MM_006218 [Cercozoa sp. M6MM]